ncbi:MAG: acyl-CoA dehydratase activase-related protein, partial [candidate division WOR-3 bacterium]
MRVAFPYMGDIRLVLEPILRKLGAEVVVPPEPNRETVARGAQLAPETICLPFKVTLGNILQALELGA